MKVVAIIPARAGSKRLPNKNKMLLKGKPLICWTIDEALKCDFIDEIIVSTNDLDILKLENNYSNVRLRFSKRPEELCQDITSTIQVIIHELKNYDRDTTVILLQPTSPLRRTYHINECYEKYRYQSYNNSVVSGYYEGKEIILNGAIYISDLRSIIFNNGFIDFWVIMYIMRREKSIDIDTIEDFKKVEEYLENGK